MKRQSLTNSGFDEIKIHVHHQKRFSAYDISKEKALKIQALMGFKPMVKYFLASEIAKKAYKILKERAYEI